MKLTDVRFDSFEFPDPLREGIEACGFEYLTPVQAKSMPITLTGQDLAVQAQTGSGKTAAFLVTIFNKLLTTPKRKTNGICPRAIVITPTRELAVQVANDAKEIGQKMDLRILLAYGGVDYQEQRQAIRDGVDLLVGTPGRLIDYLKQKVYHLRDVEIAVIDEADRMFDMGFVADIRFMLRRMSKYDERQSMLFSATLADRVMELSYEYMNVPELVEVTPDKLVAERVEQVLYHLSSDEKTGFLMGWLKNEEWSKAIVFVNTKRVGNRLRDTLNHNGVPTAILSGDVAQPQRLKVLKRFMSGDVKILVATDVASRGIHVDDISHVFNYDLPQDIEDYVHRIGRTARAGASGKAVTLACEDYVFTLPEIEDYIGHPIPTEKPPEDYIVEYEKPPRKPRPAGGGRGGPGSGRGRGGRGRDGGKGPRQGAKPSSDRRRRGGGRGSRKRTGGGSTGGAKS